MERTLKIECGTTGYYVYEGEWDAVREEKQLSGPFAYYHVDRLNRPICIFDYDFNPVTLKAMLEDERFKERCHFVELDFEENGEVLKEFDGTIKEALEYCLGRLNEQRRGGKMPEWVK